MLSKAIRPAAVASAAVRSATPATVVQRVCVVVPRAVVAQFHAGAPLLKDDDDSSAPEEVYEIAEYGVAKTPDNPYGVDKENPWYLPDNFDDWVNSDYKRLGPKGRAGWPDMPKPYDQYVVRVDPADVENKGTLWKLFTDWRTAIPLSATFATPMYIHDLFVFDERLQLALVMITMWAISKTNVGPMLTQGFKDEMKVREAFWTQLEQQQHDTHNDLTVAHQTVMGLDEDLRQRHTAERELKHIEAAAATRSVRAEAVSHMRDMLEYMVQAEAFAEEAVGKNADAAALDAISGALASDAALQQSSIEDALTALEKPDTNIFESAVATRYLGELESAWAKADEGTVDAEAVAARREIFRKKFGFADAVTADMLKSAQENPKEWAVLVAKLGGAAPTEGAKLTQKMPIDY